VRVTLTNSGTEDIVGIYAYCGMFSIEETNILTSNGWDELSTIVGGPGAVVRAGETRRWEFDDVVPPMAWSYGFVRVLCDFSPSSAHDGPIAEARAAVPGGRGTVAGTLTTEDRRTPLPGVQVVLIHTVTNLPVVSAVADGAGRFQFPELPADLYELRPVGPWALEGTMLEVQIRAGVHHDFNPLILLPGPTWLGPDATPPPTTIETSTVDVTVVDEPAPQASPRPANLADTGADVVELVAIGFLLVLAGAGLLFVRRRPTS
jgi:LPXTG-motif cell wall-anchored protein